MDVPTLLGGGSFVAKLRPDIVVVVEATDHRALNLLKERGARDRAERSEALAFLFAGVISARRVVELLYAVAQKRRGLRVLGGLRIETLDHLGIGAVVDGVIGIEVALHADERRALLRVELR